MRAVLTAIVALAGGCSLRPPLPPLELRAGEAFVAGVVSDRTEWKDPVVAILFDPPALLPGDWQPVHAGSLVVGNVRPGRVLVTIGRAVHPWLPPRVMAGLPLDVPGPGCFWFGGVEVRMSPGARVPDLATFDVDAEPVLARLAVAAPALAECARTVAVLAPDEDHPVVGPAM